MAYLGRKGASAALTSADIPDNSITAAKIVTDTIEAGDIGNDAVGTAELANDVVISTSGAITTTGAFTSIGIDDNANALAMTIDVNENIGVGCTPDAWEASMTAIDIGQQGGIAGATSGDLVVLTQNAYTDGTWKYKNTDEAAQLEINDGVYYFKVASSGTADNAISWTTGMSITNDGKVGIGTSSPTYALDIEDSIAGGWVVEINNTHTGSGGGLLINSANTSPGGQELLRINNQGNTKFEVHADGKVGIGTSSPEARLLIKGSGNTTATTSGNVNIRTTLEWSPSTG